ncbi:MAG TPA: glutamate-cysteine ligase family protein [Candidatus Polarisedimenticolaceae bacterium]|nr:glutamate-cysteine ligase family protein [Candidatus Polarisedimenticolaceae bacterium]
MRLKDTRPLNRSVLLNYFLAAATPRSGWQVGMELEKMGRDAASGAALPYDGDGPSVLSVIEAIRAARGGDPILEADKLIGLDAGWGTISLEPGGQVEWSSRPYASLDDLRAALDEHLRTMVLVGRQVGVRWVGEAVDPRLPVEAMPWMPKARYEIMRPYLGERGELAHRMMTQTASIQCAFDYSDPDDWARKFRAAALVTPLAVALFANSSRIDDRDSGYVSFRQAIWRRTDPARCGLPAIVFDDGFGPEAWLDWVLEVPTMFLHRARGLVPVGGVPFSRLLERVGCTAVKQEDWETHISTVFTEVRSYDYIEVRSADLQADPLAFSVPSFWTGLLYHADSLDAALELRRVVRSHADWLSAMDSAARHGLVGTIGGHPIGALAAEMLSASLKGLRGGAACAGSSGAAARAVELLAEHRSLEVAA